MEPRSAVLSLRGVALTDRQRARADTVDFDLAHREVAVVELDEDSDASGFIDLCLGLIEPRSVRSIASARRGARRAITTGWRIAAASAP